MRPLRHFRRWLRQTGTICALFTLVVGIFVWLSGDAFASVAAPHVIAPHKMTVNPLMLPTGRAPANPDKLQFACQLPNAPFRCYDPQQIANAYSITPLLKAGITGKMQSIVIIDAFQSPTLRDDLALFDKTFGLPDPTLNIIAPQGLTPFDPHDPAQVAFAGEINLDVEWAHAIAPKATINLVLSKDNEDFNLTFVTKFAVDHNLGSVISQSFGAAEVCEDPALIQQDHQIFLDAASKGISVLASSGDQGVAQPSCDGKTFIKSAGYPASDSAVTAVGGTQLFADVKGNYKAEITWNETDLGLPFNIASGGGFSTIFKRPSYQSGLVKASMRGVPDVSYNAAVNGGVLTVFGGAFFLFGGTSAGSPQWAGIVALTNQSKGHRTGFLNPIVYSIGGSSSQRSVFHDIIAGNNAFFFIDGSLSFTGFSASKGWDAATGLGTPLVSKLLPIL